ncbi:MAG: DNA helicase RecQ [Bacteroides sp.]|nr:DNA helicase RecQ [Bacteroides sp.]MBD5332807.1 DNA helicase RecQ [Bacteroides sp.]
MHTRLHQALKEHFGFDTFKGNQEAIMTSLLDGQDVFVLMPTGGGKSLCYQLPALMMDGTAIVISPLIALMKNQVDAIRNHSESESIAHFLNSSLNRAAIDTVKADVRNGLTKLLYVAPESLTKEENIEFMKTVKISFYAVDEAHCISEWGHDFRPEYRRIRPIINDICPRPVIALTATATPKVQHDIQKNLGMSNACVYKSSFNRPNLYYEIRPKTANIDRDIIKFIRSHPGKSGIIYCLSRKRVEELAEILKVNSIRALPYHAGMDAATRSANQDAFLMEHVDVIVATIAFGMGIDKPDVRFVIHYDMPKSLEGYYQETGRAGRDGGEGICLTFYSAKDLQKMEKFMQGKPLAEQEIGRQLLIETQSYAEASTCRRRSLLFYFGEQFCDESCNNCDNCLNPKKKVEAKEDLCAILETVIALKEKFKSDYVSDVVLGNATPTVKSYNHDELELFGCEKGTDERLIAAIIRQAVLEGYLDRDIENYGTLSVTPKGKKFINSPQSFKVVEDSDFSEEAEPDLSKNAASGAADTELFLILKDLRKKVAKQLGLPPYIIFQDPSLEAMATTYPISIEELQNIPGVGQGKAKKYGAEFVKVIKRHVEDNEIDRPDDLRVRSVPDRNSTKLYIITLIDRKIPLPEIARAKGLEYSELLDEIEAIVNSGTRIDINYYINEIIDEDSQEELFDFFRESESDDLNEAYREFGADFTEEEIRLAHIKFVSELGN